MSSTCEAILPLIAAQASGTLAPAERSELEEHLLVCQDCPDIARRLEGELATVRCEPRDPPATLWTRIERAVELERAGNGPSTALRILLACTFCKGGLDRREAIYCAACLAPHHQDCLETYGRCAVSGCGETRTVAPRGLQKRAPRRRFGIFLAIAVGAAGSVAAVTAARVLKAPQVAEAPAPVIPKEPTPQPPTSVRVPPADSAEALALTDESDRPAPAYPWAPPLDEITKKLQTKKLTFNFSATPLSEVVQFLQDFLDVNIVVSKEIDTEQVKLDLRLRDVVAWDALIVIMSQTGFCFEFKNEAVFIEPRGGPNEDYTWPKPFSVPALFASARDEDFEGVSRRLDAQKVNLNLDDTPFTDAIDLMHELTSINFVISTEARDLIENEQLKVRLKVKDITVRNALNLLLSCKDDFTLEIKNGVIVIRTRGQEPAGELAAKKISLDVRGGTVPELIHTLAALGVRAYASPEAWASRGTLTLVVNDQRVEDALLAIGSDSSLRAQIVKPRGADHEIVAIQGELTSARGALTQTVPAFAGVATEVRELRERLVADLAQRHALRNDTRARPDEIAARERAVNLTASSILSLLRRVARIAGAKERLATVTQELPKVERTLAGVEANLAEVPADLGPRIAVIASRIAVLDAESDPLSQQYRAVCAEIEKLSSTGGDEKKLTQLMQKHDELNKEIGLEHDRLEKEQAALKTQLFDKTDKLTLQRDALKRRDKELLHEEGAAEKDLKTLVGLERGYRLAEAENPD